MKIVCADTKEYAYMVRMCLVNQAEDNCKCCVLRTLCVRGEQECDDIEEFLELETERGN